MDSKIERTRSVAESFFNYFPEIIIPFVLCALCFCVLLLIDRLENKILKLSIAFCLVAFICAYVFTEATTGTLFISYFMLSVIMCSATYILGFMPFGRYDYAVMFSAFMLVHLSGRIAFAAIPTKYLMILIILAVISRIRLKSIRGHIFYLWLNFSIVLFLYQLIDFCFDTFVRRMGYAFNDVIVIKIGIWLASSAFLIAVSAAFIFFLKRLCYDYFNDINAMGKKYPTIERHFITISVGVLVIYIIAQNIIIFSTQSFTTDFVFRFAYFFSIFIQLWFLTQMFNVTNLRESLYDKELENMSLLLYSSDIEKNFAEIRGIKHDIKNLFFTMGQYVERSDDDELKDFYKNKIFPFAEGEIKKNDLYAKLVFIENEQLRSFLYYKLTQALELGVTAKVEIYAVEKFSVNIGFSDLVRILGILIDNAVEESLLLGKDKAELSFCMRIDKGESSIKITNKVREETLASGIKPGVSSKSDERGHGLVIVKQILLKYNFAALNSYFKDGRYVQNLMIYEQ